MGCGASSPYSGSGRNFHHANKNIRINIIEATSILDYEDTDTVSSRRQTPVIPWQSQKQSVSSEKPFHNSAEVVDCQVDEAVERPSSPVPQNSKILHRTSTSIQLIEKNEKQNAAH